MELLPACGDPEASKLAWWGGASAEESPPLLAPASSAVIEKQETHLREQLEGELGCFLVGRISGLGGVSSRSLAEDILTTQWFMNPFLKGRKGGGEVPFMRSGTNYHGSQDLHS